MKTLDIVKWPNDILNTKTKKVEVFDDELVELANSMIQKVKDTESVGIAANQVGLNISLIVVKVPDDGKECDGNEIVLVNPNVVSSSGKVSIREGCLSMPDMYEFIPRSEAVSVSYQDLKGNSHVIEANGLLAIVLQHEIDHLNGKTILDRMSRVKKYNFIKTMKKRWLL
jgi:peptide deformylase